MIRVLGGRGEGESAFVFIRVVACYARKGHCCVLLVERTYDKIEELRTRNMDVEKGC